MRLSKKYKQLSNLEFPLPLTPSRILKFRRPKWKRVQNFLSFSRKKRLSWDKISLNFKSGIVLKRHLLASFDNSIKVSFFKRALSSNLKKSTHQFLVDCLVKPLFRIDILLSRLFFYSSSFQSRQVISNGDVLLNFKKVSPNVFLKKGDILNISPAIVGSTFETISSKFLLNRILNLFVEIDFYTNTVVVVKDISELTNEDLILIVSETFDLRKFKNYLT